MYIHSLFKRYKLQIKEGKIYDPIRKKFVALTPEERVRQQTIKFMLQRLKIPSERIGVEKALSSLGDAGNRKRVDICVFGETGEVIAVIECKADYIGGGESPYQQAIDYIESIGVRNYFVVDGWEIHGYRYIIERNQFDPMEQIPEYATLLTLSR